MSSTDTCAACGKEGDSLKSCTACKLVKYCNRDCQIAHRPQHKKACKKRAAELYDEKLFQEIEPEDCPICMLPLPIKDCESTFETCCGKVICDGCAYEMEVREGNNLCAFCRVPYAKTDDEHVLRVKKLMDNGNGEAFNMFASYYANGTMGIPQNRVKANEMWLKAGELGCATGYQNLGVSYKDGTAVEINKKKAKNYWELAAMMGHVIARHDIGVLENEAAGNHHRALKHWIIAVKAGYEKSLGAVKQGFMFGVVTKDEYANTLRAYQKSQDEMKSIPRDEAAKRRVEL